MSPLNESELNELDELLQHNTEEKDEEQINISATEEHLLLSPNPPSNPIDDILNYLRTVDGADDTEESSVSPIHLNDMVSVENYILAIDVDSQTTPSPTNTPELFLNTPDIQIPEVNLDTISNKNSNHKRSLKRLRKHRNNNTIPKQLQLHVEPALKLSDDLQKKWDSCLLGCSTKLTNILITHHEEKLLTNPTIPPLMDVNTHVPVNFRRAWPSKTRLKRKLHFNYQTVAKR